MHEPLPKGLGGNRGRKRSGTRTENPEAAAAAGQGIPVPIMRLGDERNAQRRQFPIILRNRLETVRARKRHIGI